MTETSTDRHITEAGTYVYPIIRHTPGGGSHLDPARPVLVDIAANMGTARTIAAETIGSDAARLEWVGDDEVAEAYITHTRATWSDEALAEIDDVGQPSGYVEERVLVFSIGAHPVAIA
jgi:hypothetical protein